ncbi:hypothetical protein PUNSTDRAFT_135332 [Punctularia strigosozonata HHB-11173 SS5]|uniref:uncharacterized protein n=1 Tax=Punctularia strigosozonata (strain HHB-11173) TaxID=741275 RepID=UPI000441830F|nr:uncharacterized protein PUNSTDRAFT_135332 [Punctularia strigosozonata HHB-11173 SS5]EIN07816.1 hypothetical protein PUNSTDRAFT_135332 [Punctularia strigosozonata HHB-11173 SS5]
MLRERRNQLAPIFRLPLDVISEIFCLISIPSSARRSAGFLFHGHRFMSVCRYWRHIGIEIAKVWSVIPNLRSKQMIGTFISRSKNTLLDVEIDVQRNGDPKKLLSNLHRIGALDLYGDKGYTILEELRRPAPVMASCHIHLSETCLPADFLGLHAPHLRHLRIKRTLFHWKMLCCTSLVQSLTILELWRIPGSTLPSGARVASALRAMPSLQKLVLVVSDCAQKKPGKFRGDIIMLSHLTTLDLRGSGSWICRILRRIRVPSTACISLKPYNMKLAPVLEFLEGHCTRHGDESSIRRLSLDGPWSLTAHSSTKTSSLPLLRISDPAAGQRTLRYLVRQLRLDELEVVVLQRYWASTTHDIAPASFLAPCKSATRLHIAARVCRQLLPDLYRRKQPTNEHVSRYDLLPALQFVRIKKSSSFWQGTADSMRRLMEARHADSNINGTSEPADANERIDVALCVEENYDSNLDDSDLESINSYVPKSELDSDYDSDSEDDSDASSELYYYYP